MDSGYQDMERERIARLEAEVEEWRSLSRIGTEKAQALAAEVAELKREFSEVVKLIPAGRVSVMVMKSWRERGLLEE